MMAYTVTLIPGDGVGPEITEATRRTLDAGGVEINWEVKQAGIPAQEESGDRDDPTALGTSQVGDAIIDKLKETPVHA